MGDHFRELGRPEMGGGGDLNLSGGDGGRRGRRGEADEYLSVGARNPNGPYTVGFLLFTSMECV